MFHSALTAFVVTIVVVLTIQNMEGIVHFAKVAIGLISIVTFIIMLVLLIPRPSWEDTLKQVREEQRLGDIKFQRDSIAYAIKESHLAARSPD